MSGPAVIVAGGLTLIRSAGGGHRIELHDGGALVACLESIEPKDREPAASANWPASPPVQEWHDETRAGGTVLMAVGRAGRSHWSLSCEVTPDGRATFDVAARINEMPERLGSGYRLLVGDGQLTAPYELHLKGGGGVLVDSITTRLSYDAAERTTSLEPVITPNAAWPQTIRWSYTIEHLPT